MEDPLTNLNLGAEDVESPEDVPDLPPDALAFDENDIDDGFAVARLSYIFNFLLVPFCLVPYFKRDNAYSLFHAKQALALWIGLMGTGLLGSLLLPLGVGFWLWLGGFPLLWILNWLGLGQVTAEMGRPLPLLGVRPQTWFEGQVDEEDF